jgi:signal transduction histidine kinase
LKEVLGRVTRLFDSLIELSQLESKEMILDFKNLNPNRIIKKVYESSIKRAIEKGIQLLLDLGDNDKLIRADQAKLEKILFSLVDNSIKYTHYGNVVVRSYCQDKKMFISVTDTGEGMNQSDIDDLLQPFGQEEDAFTRKYQGIGLGLTIAYRLTKLMGGDVEIISQKNVGTKIILSFNIVENVNNV